MPAPKTHHLPKEPGEHLGAACGVCGKQALLGVARLAQVQQQRAALPHRQVAAVVVHWVGVGGGGGGGGGRSGGAATRPRTSAGAPRNPTPAHLWRGCARWGKCAGTSPPCGAPRSGQSGARCKRARGVGGRERASPSPPPTHPTPTHARVGHPQLLQRDRRLPPVGRAGCIQRQGRCARHPGAESGDHRWPRAITLPCELSLHPPRTLSGGEMLSDWRVSCACGHAGATLLAAPPAAPPTHSPSPPAAPPPPRPATPPSKASSAAPRPPHTHPHSLPTTATRCPPLTTSPSPSRPRTPCRPRGSR